MEQGSFDIFRIAALAVAGCVAGMMNAVAGGGTLVTFPTLVLTGIPSIPANATSTIALLPAALGSAAGHRKKIRGIARWLRNFGPVSFVRVCWAEYSSSGLRHRYSTHWFRS